MNENEMIEVKVQG